MNIDKALHYAHNPPFGNPTHYNTYGGMRSEYLNLDGEWFMWDTSKWVWLPWEPPIKTAIWQDEVKPVAQQQKPRKVEFKQIDTPIYSNSKYKGD